MYVCVCARARAFMRACVRGHVCIVHPGVCQCEWVWLQVCVRV